MKSAVIVGAGFAGISAAKKLAKKLPEGWKLVVVNPSSRFTFKPLLPEVATGAFGEEIACEDVPGLFKSRKFEFVQKRADKIDLAKQFVLAGKREIHYDYLIISIGSETDFLKVPHAEKHALKLGSVSDSFKIKKALLEASRRARPRIAVIGAGATGSELAVEISAFMQSLKRKCSVMLIDAAKKPMPGVSVRFRKRVLKSFQRKKIRLMLQKRVTAIGGNVIAAGNKKIRADVIVWAAGIKPASVRVHPRLKMPEGCFPADKYLRLKNYPDVFAIGDCAVILNPDGSRVPKLAQSAVLEGKAAAGNVIASISGSPLKQFSFNSRGFVVPLSKGNAVAEVKGFVFSGFAAWALNRFIYLSNMHALRHKFRVAGSWTLTFLKKRDSGSGVRANPE